MTVTISKWCAICGRYKPHARTIVTEYQTHTRPMCVECDVEAAKHEAKKKRRMKW